MQKNEPRKFIAGKEQDSTRLDAALAFLYPELGLRARRRLWDWCKVRLDGKPAGPGEYVRQGQLVEVEPIVKENAASAWIEDLRIVSVGGGFCAVYKPAGLPSADIGGSPLANAEQLVKANWDVLAGKWMAERSTQGNEQKPLPGNLFEDALGDAESPLLCNRLDTATSGLLLWAFSRASLESFRVLEARGEVDKHYHALVEGEAPEQIYMDRALNMSNRDKTVVLEDADPDPARHTLARRVEIRRAQIGACSLLDVTIRRGARHQIRAHLAAAGHPICGDSLYGAKKSDAGIMYLHHYAVSFQGFRAETLPDWAIG